MPITQKLINGRTRTWLGDLLPDWSGGMKAKLDVPTDEARTLTGDVEYGARATAPRWTVEFDVLLDDQEAQALRALFGTPGKAESLAVPLWFAIHDAADWATRLLAAQINVGWPLQAPQNPQFTTDGSLPTGNEQIAPVLTGRARHPKITAETDGLLRATLVIEEDSPYEERILPRPASGSETTYDADAWPLDWSTLPTEETEGYLTTEVIGDGRVLSQGGQASDPRRAITAEITLQGTALARFLRFWGDTQVSGLRWAYDLPLAPSENPNTGAPHAWTHARFTAAPLTLRFLADHLATIPLRIEDASRDTASAPNALLFHLEKGGVTIARLTDWEADITTSGSTVWTAARIEAESITASLDPAKDRAKIKLDLADVPGGIPHRVWLYETEIPTRCTISQAVTDDATAVPAVLFTGNLSGRKLRLGVLDAEVKLLGGYLERTTPNWRVGRTCNYALFDAGCRLQNPTGMAASNWEATGELNRDVNDSRVVHLWSLDTSGIPEPAGTTVRWDDHNYYAGGVLRRGRGLSAFVRQILSSAINAEGTILTLTLDRAPDPALCPDGSTVTILPGCGGGYIEDCRQKFGNDAAFGGAPLVPDWMDSTSPGGPKGGK